MTALDLPRKLADRQRAGDARRGRAWALTAVVLGPLVLGYLLVATVIALITAWVPGSGFSLPGVFAAAAPAWLAAHHVPLVLGGAPLGVLPLLPTLALMALVARAANRAVWRLRRRTVADARLVITVVAVAHALVGVVLALAVSRGGLSVSAPEAALGCAAVSGAAATLGVTGPCRLFPALTGELDVSVRRGVRAGLIGLLGLVAGGLGAVVLGLVLSLGSVARLFAHTAPGAASAFGLLLLCLGYLPNAAAAGMSFLAGPGFSLGLVNLSVVGMHGGPVPGVPLVAALPTAPAPWWPVGMLVPTAAGVLVGWWVRSVDPDPQARVRVVGVAAGVAAVGGFLLAALAGGRLGKGPFDPVQFPAGLFAVAVFCWIALPGAAVAWLAGPRAPQTPKTADQNGAAENSADQNSAADGTGDGNTHDGSIGEDSTGDESAAEADSEVADTDRRSESAKQNEPAAAAGSQDASDAHPGDDQPAHEGSDEGTDPDDGTDVDGHTAGHTDEPADESADPGDGADRDAGDQDAAGDRDGSADADDRADPRHRPDADDAADAGDSADAGDPVEAEGAREPDGEPDPQADRRREADSASTAESAEQQAGSGRPIRPATGADQAPADAGWTVTVDEWDEFDAIVDAEARHADEPPPDDSGGSGR